MLAVAAAAGLVTMVRRRARTPLAVDFLQVVGGMLAAMTGVVRLADSR